MKTRPRPQFGALPRMVVNAAPLKRRPPNPLKYDPSRTLTLRRGMMAKVRQRFKLLSGRIYKLIVEQDALGLAELPHDVAALNETTTALNRFCPTGEGGGVDPSCSGGDGKSSPMDKAKAFTSKIRQVGARFKQKLVDRYGAKTAVAIVVAAQATSWASAAGAVAVGLPGAWIPSPLASLPYVALAEIKHQLTKHGPVGNAGEDLTPEELATAVQELVDELKGHLDSLVENANPNHDEKGRFASADSLGDASDVTESTPGAPRPNVLLRGDMKKVPFAADTSEETGAKIRQAMQTGRVVGKKEVPIASLVTRQVAVSKGSVEHFMSPAGQKQASEDRVKPVVVQVDGKNYLYDGNHRAVADHLLGKKTITATVYVPKGKKFVVNSLTVNAGAWAFKTSPEKIAEFEEWLRQQMATTLLGKTDEQLWGAYIQEGFKKGAGRAWDDVKPKKADEPLDFYQGTKQQFLKSAFGQPETIDKVKLLAGRTFDELENVTTDMATRMTRSLADGLVQGKGAMEIAKDLQEATDFGSMRAERVARTEIIRAHAEGQLTGMEELGVEEVGVAVEWSTAGDERVCELCEPLEGVVMKIDEARGLIPRHPNCRCAFIPANVGEDDKDQTRGKVGIDSAFRFSIKMGDDEDRYEAPSIGRVRPESILHNVVKVLNQDGRVKKRIVIHGLTICIETEMGQKRKPWHTQLVHDYGYIEGFAAPDGDSLDAFVGPDPTSPDVFVIDQTKADGTFDEHKVLFGFHSRADAEAGYLANYSPNWNGLGSIRRMSIPQLREWMEEGVTRNRSFFADCDRDEKGRCLPGDGATKGSYVSTEALKAVQSQARAKGRAVPQPTAAEIAEAHRRMDEKGADDYEMEIRGNTSDRASSRRRLLEEFGDGKKCPCTYCGLKLTDSTVTRDKILTAREGGRYRQSNLVPACLGCNKRRSDTPWRSIKWPK